MAIKSLDQRKKENKAEKMGTKAVFLTSQGTGNSKIEFCWEHKDKPNPLGGPCCVAKASLKMFFN